VLRGALRALSECGLRVFAADGGSPGAFLDFAARLPGLHLVPVERPGVVGQSRAALNAAARAGCRAVIYTESDKEWFFRHHLSGFVAGWRPSTGVRIASRSRTSLATFPATQRETENTINRLFAREIGLDADFCYGPLMIHPKLLPLLERVEPSLGWGWRFYVMGVARRAGYALDVYENDFPCPPGQATDDTAERCHRMGQLVQNLKGLVLSLQDEGATADIRLQPPAADQHRHPSDPRA
jgi:hypothetical protein